MKNLQTHTSHLREPKFFTENGIKKMSYSSKIACGRNINYAKEESKMSNFPSKVNRCKTCENRYNELVREIKELNKH